MIRFHSIRSRLLVWFIIFSVSPLFLLSVSIYRVTDETLKKDTYGKLLEIAKDKLHKFDDYIVERRRDAKELARTPMVYQALAEIARAYEREGKDSLLYGAADSKYREFLSRYIEDNFYYDLFLINPKGDLVFTVLHESDFATNLITGPYRDTELAGVFERTITMFETEISDFVLYEPSAIPAAFIAAPVFAGNKLEGVVALQLVAKEIQNALQDYTGLGNTGEIVAGSLMKNKVIVVNPLRHDPEAAFNRIFQMNSPHMPPLRKSVLGEQGFGEFIDYRGEKTLAVWQYSHAMRVGIVVKIDAAEALSSIAFIRFRMFHIALASVILVCMAVFFISRSLTAPIKKLSEGAEIIGKGNLDHCVGVKSFDEIGQLSRTFDKMALNLKKTTASRDELDREVKERKRAEGKLKKTLFDLERSNQDLERFAYVASHDLQEPLRMVVSYMQLIEKRYKGKLDADADDFIDFAVDGAMRMQGMINDLLALSRVSSRGKPFLITHGGTVLEKALANLQKSMEESGAVVSHGPLPAFMGDESQLLQLFQNLLANAIKFRGENPPEIYINAERIENSKIPTPRSEIEKGWLFSFRDNGIGIDPQFVDRIFSIFQRLHGKEYPGSGIGLSICQKIVERHGGKIWVESEPGKGATFYFTIPEGGA